MLLMKNTLYVFTLLFSIAPAAFSADVVINEIFYNAPDDVDDLQWIEFHNSSDQLADLSGWTLDDGKVYTFPARTTVAARGFLVVALNPDRFSQSYTVRALGPLKRPLKRGSEKLQLRDRRGKLVDIVRYKDEPPWPVSADGCSASLERICPSASGEIAENWAGSPLPPTPKPSGTPGRQNTSHSTTLPPKVTLLPVPSHMTAEETLQLEANASGNVRELTLLYRVVGADGADGKEVSLSMAKRGNRYVASVPPQAAGSLVRYRLKVVAEDGATRHFPAEHDLRPTFSVYVHEKWKAADIPFGLVIRGGPDKLTSTATQSDARGFGGRGGPGMGGRGPRPNFGSSRQETPRPPRGSSAFVYVDHKTGKTSVFDYISTVPRNNNRGFKVFFHKDNALGELRSVNLLYEDSEWSLMAENLAYDVYHRAGSPAPLSEFVRVWVDGRLAGHHLMVERPNRPFLRRNGLDDEGNLYKKLWMARDIVGQHDKRTNTQTGHDDLLELLDQLRKTNNNPNDQWKVIQDNFDVEQVATYFAVNMVLSHWDGFFNNYFTYHDTKRNKWQIYPWDQDKTWGYYDGLPDDQVFFDMPLTFGMAGDRPPGTPADAEPAGGRRGGFGRGGRWWREGGPFSRPLLANPHFRKVFLSRVNGILDRVYTQGIYFPMIDEMATRLSEDAAIRATLRGEDESAGARLLARDAQLLKTHLTKRRQFLLEQNELQTPATESTP